MSFLPLWAVGKYRGTLERGLQLATRDGRKTGNAVIAAELGECFGLYIWHVVTDIGNELFLTQAEIEELFHEPKWVMDVTTHNGYKINSLLPTIV